MGRCIVNLPGKTRCSEEKSSNQSNLSDISVLAFTKYADKAASTRQRLLLYQEYLRERGIGITWQPLLENEYLERFSRGQTSPRTKIALSYAKRLGQLLRQKNFDILWVQYELFPYLPAAFERLAFLTGKPVLCDYDDAIFHMYDSHKNKAVRWLLARKLETLLRGSSACSCGNKYLRAYAKRYCNNSVIIPTVVDTTVFFPAKNGARRRVTVGWIGSPSTWRYVTPLSALLSHIAQSNNTNIKVVGAGSKAKKVPGIQFLEWIQEAEVSVIQTMDIGIMPLPNEPWAWGKCGYKLIQYMACGLPVVASPVGVNCEIIQHGENGFLASSEKEWAEALDVLIRNPELRSKMGSAGRAKVEAHYSLKAHAPRVEALLRSMVR
jgi:glycosyltransferase involved in cell wall biosynthesis